MKHSINPTEYAIMEMVYRSSVQELNKHKRVPSIDHIHYRRLAYFLIEARRAAYQVANVKRTLKNVLDEFEVGYDAYYDWREKWHRFLPSNVKILID